MKTTIIYVAVIIESENEKSAYDRLCSLLYEADEELEEGKYYDFVTIGWNDWAEAGRPLIEDASSTIKMIGAREANLLFPD